MSTKFLDATGLAHFWEKLKERFKKTDGTVFYGQVDSTSTATAFTAQIDGITEYHEGLIVVLKNGVVTSAENFTININGLGALPSYTNLAASTRDTTIFNINYTMMFVYEERVSGGNWLCYRGYDANTNTIGYQLRTNSMSLPMKSVTYRYRLLFTSADGGYYVPANNSSSTNATASRTVCQDKIDPFGDIRYYGTTASVAANSRPSAAYLWEQYNITLGYSFNRTGAALALTSWKPVYVKCTPQSDGSAIMDSTTPYVQALPSTEDGKIYIFLGIATAATTMELLPNHPVYEYKDGAIRPYTNAIASSGGVTSWNGQTGDVTYTETDPVFTASPAHEITAQDMLDWTNKADVLSCSTTTRTPTEVSHAVINGSTVVVNHTDQTYGWLVFMSFNEAASANLLVSTTSFNFNGTIYLYTLIGDLQNDTWSTNVNILAETSDIPTKTSDLTNDSGFITGYTETDPTVPSWAKASTKPSYTASEVGALASNGGQVTGDVTLYAASGDSPALIFQRGTLTDNYNDWRIMDSGGYLYFAQRGSGSTSFANQVYFNTSGGVYATTFNGSGANLTGVLKPADITSSITSSSTNSQAAGAKAVYDMIGNVETLLAAL